MPLNFIKRLFLSAIVSEGARMPLMQRIAQKTARIEHEAPDKIVLWARATCIEAKKDVENIWAKLRGSEGENATKKQVEVGSDTKNGRKN